MRAVRLELLEGMDLIKSSAKGAKYKVRGKREARRPWFTDEMNPALKRA
jgi:hypothetical protein